jgi:hypothetical protein
LWALLSLSLSACGASQPGSQATLVQTTNPPAQTVTPTVLQNTATQTPTLTPTPKQETDPETLPEGTPSKTPAPVVTPALGPEAFRLQPWDRTTALQLVKSSGTQPIVEDNENLRNFYQVSLLQETWLDFPDLQEDPELLLKMADYKGSSDTYFATYGLLHDHSVEPFRKWLELALNDGSTTPDNLQSRLESLGVLVVIDEQEFPADRLFKIDSSTLVIKVFDDRGWNFFAIHSDPKGGFSIAALYPEWEQNWWSDETAQITDLNANGKNEIAVTHNDWGTGATHYCQRSLKLYEWDGSGFRNLITGSLKTGVNTDFGTCLEITFPPDPRGGQKIVAGTELSTLCPEMPYRKQTTFRWDGKTFKRQPAPKPTPAKAGRPDRCTIDWALKAGAWNDSAVKLLAAALADWPAEAEKDWGPAARDYFRLKLAAWMMQRGDPDQGLALMKQVRDHPAVPEYTLPQRVAETFLKAYIDQGYYRAAFDVDKLYKEELPPSCGECLFGNNLEGLLAKWGFVEREWDVEYGNHYPHDFFEIQPLGLTIDQKKPASLEELQALLEGNGLHTVWSRQIDLDGQGDEDWLIEIKEDEKDYISRNFYAFLRQGKKITTLYLSDIYIKEKDTPDIRRLESFVPVPGGPHITIFQVGPRLYAFRFTQNNGEVQVETDLNSWIITTDEEENRVMVQDWKIEGERLVVQYDGREAVYMFNSTEGKLVPTGYAPELQEQNIRLIEKAIYFEQAPEKALPILKELLAGRIYEDDAWSYGGGPTNSPRLRPYLMYLLGLAYERCGDPENAAKAYWQLWHDYPAYPYSTAAQSKLVQR